MKPQWLHDELHHAPPRAENTPIDSALAEAIVAYRREQARERADRAALRRIRAMERKAVAPHGAHRQRRRQI